MKITTDLHVHTSLSACACSSAIAKDYVNEASKYGFTKIGFADHTWDEKISCPHSWYVPQNVERLMAKYDEFKKQATDSIKILVGCETEYDYPNRDIALTPESASMLDFVLVPNSHTHITMPKEFYDNRERHAKYMLDAWYDIMNSRTAEYVTAIAHPFHAVCCPYDYHEVMKCITDKQYEDCFRAAKEKDIAVEINTSCFVKGGLNGAVNDYEALRMLSIAKECGCKFTFGTDAHDIPELSSAVYGYVIASALELKQEDILEL